MTPITALGSRYGIQGALGRSVKRASGVTEVTINRASDDLAILVASSPTRAHWDNLVITGAPLIRYDVSSLSEPVISAKVVFTRTKTVTNAAVYSANWYGLAAANADWVFGYGFPAPSGICCWNAKAADGSGGVTTAWAGSAGCQTAGTDYVDTVIGSVTYPRGGTAGDQYELVFNSAGITLVNSWISNSANNYGIMAKNMKFSNVIMDKYPPLIVTY